MSNSNCQVGIRSHSLRGRIPIILGFILSFFALVLPFYNVRTVGGWSGFNSASTSSSYYWSFKYSAMTYHSLGDIIREYGLDQPFYASWIKDVVEAPTYPSVYFDAYWSYFNLYMGGFSELLIALFMMQLMTLGTALSSLFIRSWTLRLATILSGVAVFGLMCYSSMSDPFRYYGSLRLGFWFAVLAEIVFVIGLVHGRAKESSLKKSLTSV
jgi:hypothetical protein